jgi:hypothetical protein
LVFDGAAQDAIADMSATEIIEDKIAGSNRGIGFILLLSFYFPP